MSKTDAYTGAELKILRSIKLAAHSSKIHFLRHLKQSSGRVDVRLLIFKTLPCRLLTIGAGRSNWHHLNNYWIALSHTPALPTLLQAAFGRCFPSSYVCNRTQRRSAVNAVYGIGLAHSKGHLCEQAPKYIGIRN